MPEVIPLIDAESVPPGESAEVVAEGRIFAVFNVDGTFHVLDGICPHAGGPLGKGILDGSIVTCPWHGWQFDVRDGQSLLSPAVKHPTIEVQLSDDQAVLVQLPAEESR